MRQIQEYLLPYLKDPNLYSHRIILGYNTDIDAAWEDISSLGGAIPFLSGADSHIHLDSDSVEDDPDKGGAVVGTGAHSVKVFFINTAGEPDSETIEMNGTAAVISISTDVDFVNEAYVVDAGTALATTGNIIIENAAENVTLMQILAGETRTFNCAYKVPTGYRFDIVGIKTNSVILATGAASLSYLRLLVTDWNETAGTLTTVDSEHWTHAVSGSEPMIEFFHPLRIPAGKVFRLQAKGAAANNYVAAMIEGFLVKV